MPSLFARLPNWQSHDLPRGHNSLEASKIRAFQRIQLAPVLVAKYPPLHAYVHSRAFYQAVFLFCHLFLCFPPPPSSSLTVFLQWIALHVIDSSLDRERERDRMLQRAASNAYSWWWASHIRTKQSRWLEENLKGMRVGFFSLILSIWVFLSSHDLLVNINI